MGRLHQQVRRGSIIPRNLPDAPLRIGRILQCVFEHPQQKCSVRPKWESRIDHSPSNDLWILHRLADARTVRSIEDWMRCQIGITGATLLRKILAEGLTYSDIAKAKDRLGKDGTSFIAKLFRAHLEDLALAWRVSQPLSGD